MLSLDDDDPLGFGMNQMNMGGGYGDNNNSGGVTITIPTEMHSQVQKWYNNVLITMGTPPIVGEVVGQRRAVIYENELFLVSFMGEYKAHKGRASITFMNKSHSETITNLSVTIPTVEYMTINKQDPPSSMSPGQDVRMMLALECMRPFCESPSMNISFITSGQKKYMLELKLPVAACSFFEPIQADKDTYMSRWKLLEADKTEVQDIFQIPSPITPDVMNRLRNTLFPSFHIGLAVGIDSGTTATGSCSFRTGTLNAEGAPIAVGAMVRLEADVPNNRFRLTCRAKHALIVQSIVKLMKDQLTHGV